MKFIVAYLARDKDKSWQLANQNYDDHSSRDTRKELRQFQGAFAYYWRSHSEIYRIGIAGGIIPDDIPGIGIRAARGLVELEIGVTKNPLDVASAKQFAKELGGVARPQSTVFPEGKT